jgi:hypothetical protein
LNLPAPPPAELEEAEDPDENEAWNGPNLYVSDWWEELDAAAAEAEEPPLLAAAAAAEELPPPPPPL